MNRRLVLLLGEGNFSFARILARKVSTLPTIGASTDLIATDFVNTTDCDESILANINELESLGVPVWLDVDSTRLPFHERLCQVLSGGKYSTLTVVFNFPHVHNIKMKINLNRDLLRNTFASIEALLQRHSQFKFSSAASVYISLCHGQSGLNEVEPTDRHRSWSDSWQLTEMAAAGNFVLTDVSPFGSEFINILTGEGANEASRRQFEHNCKCFFSDFSKEETKCTPFYLTGSEHTNVHKSFGYRLQNRPFNQLPHDNQFKGGNVFQFEHRDDVLSSLGSSESDIFQKSIVQKFIASVRSLLHRKWSSISFSTNDFGSPFKYCLQIDDIPPDSIECILDEIGQNLTSSGENSTEQQQQQQYSIVTTPTTNKHMLIIGDRICSTVQSGKIMLDTEACIQIRYKLKYSSILHSKYLSEMENPIKGEKPASVLTTGKLYPRLYNRDISFWVEASEVNSCVESNFTRIARNFLGASLVSLNLKDRYIKSPLVSSYCFALQIQSLDRAMNRWKVAEMMNRLQERVLAEMTNVRLR